MFTWINNRRLERQRGEALLEVHEVQRYFEEMLQRALANKETPDEILVGAVRGELSALERRVASEPATADQLDEWARAARSQGHLRAYVCPQREIANYGAVRLDELEEWRIPRQIVAKLRVMLGAKIANVDHDPAQARSALRALLTEYDSWNEYTGDYEDTMFRYTIWLSITMILALPASIVILKLCPPAFLASVLTAGLAGSCVSVMRKMPTLDVGLSGDLEGYRRRVLIRLSVGSAASLIGCALLTWGLLPISIQGISFLDITTACTSNTTNCTGRDLLVFVALP